MNSYSLPASGSTLKNRSFKLKFKIRETGKSVQDKIVFFKGWGSDPFPCTVPVWAVNHKNGLQTAALGHPESFLKSSKLILESNWPGVFPSNTSSWDLPQAIRLEDNYLKMSRRSSVLATLE